MKTAKLKAYEVYDGDEGWCIQFATNGATARRNGADELGTEFEYIEHCRRKPSFDQYAPGPVPAQALIAEGWWFECFHCGRRTADDMDGDDMLDGQEVNVVVDGDNVFCSQACASITAANRRANEAAKVAMVELAETKFPGCTVTRVHVYGTKLEPSERMGGIKCSANFMFPGAKYGATWVFGEEFAHVAAGDLEAFEGLYGSADAA